MKRILLGCFAFMILLSACSKKDSEIRPVNSDLKSAFAFLPGSYWVYKDSVSGMMDSIAVTSNSYFITKDADGIARDRIAIFMKEYFNKNDADTTLWDLELFEQSAYLLWGYRNTANRSIVYSGYQLFDFPFKVHPPMAFENNFYSLNEIKSTYTIGTTAFDHVATINISNSTETYNDQYYVTAGTGIVKMRIQRPTDGVNFVWELQRYNIVK